MSPVYWCVCVLGGGDDSLLISWRCARDCYREMPAPPSVVWR